MLEAVRSLCERFGRFVFCTPGTTVSGRGWPVLNEATYDLVYCGGGLEIGGGYWTGLSMARLEIEMLFGLLSGHTPSVQTYTAHATRFPLAARCVIVLKVQARRGRKYSRKHLGLRAIKPRGSRSPPCPPRLHGPYSPKERPTPDQPGGTRPSPRTACYFHRNKSQQSEQGQSSIPVQ